MNAEQQQTQTQAQTANDALVYVRTVKLRFGGDQGHVYEAFLDVMRDFKSGRCVSPLVSLSLFPWNVFRWDRPLSLSRRLFFLPPKKKKKLTTWYIFSISARRYDTADVVKRVKKLLKGHEDLLDGFNCFLPDVSHSFICISMSSFFLLCFSIGILFSFWEGVSFFGCRVVGSRVGKCKYRKGDKNTSSSSSIFQM